MHTAPLVQEDGDSPERDNFPTAFTHAVEEAAPLPIRDTPTELAIASASGTRTSVRVDEIR